MQYICLVTMKLVQDFYLKLTENSRYIDRLFMWNTPKIHRKSIAYLPQNLCNPYGQDAGCTALQQSSVSTTRSLRPRRSQLRATPRDP